MIDLSMLPDFIAEASEHLEEMESDLLRLEGDLGNRDILNDIFRAAHTIKGSAEYLGMEKIAELSHKLENLLEMLRLGERTANREIFDTLIESIDRMALLTEDLEQFEAEKTDTADIIERIDRLSENPSEQDAAPESEQELAMTDAPQTYLGTCAPPRDDNLAASDHDTAPDHPVFPDIIDENRLSEDSEDEDISDETKEDAAEEDLFLGDISEDDGFPSDADEAKEDARAEGGFLADLPEDENLLADVLNDAEEMTFEDDAVAEDKAASETEADSHITLTADDIYDDEYDDELFDIFIQHLKENISFIKNQTEHLSDSKDKGEELGKCLGYLNSLQSSANYMDYRNLTGFYEKWISEIESIREHLFLGKEIAFASPDGLKNDVAAGMMAYVNEIARHFPQVTDSDSEPKGDLADDAEEAAELPPQIQDAPEADAEGSVVSEVSDTFAPENLKSQDESPDMETEDDLFSDDMGEFEAADTDIPNEEPPPPLPRAEAEDTDEGGRPSSSDYQGLFGELDDAFDALADDLDSEPEPESEAASEDLEEKLAASATEGPASSPETEKRPGRQAGASDWEAIPEAIQEASEPSENLVALETSDEPQSQGKIERPVSHEHIALETEQASEIYGSYEAGNRADTDKIATKAPGPTEPEHLPEKFVKKQTLRVDARKIDSLMNQVGELVVSRAWFSQLYSEMRELQQHLHEKIRLDQREMKPVRALTFKLSEATVALGRVANELQEGVMRVRMLPIAQLFNRYPRLVRDLIHDTDKKVHMDIVGEETELDKMVIEEISDPLVHIIRNAVDHGCETTEERHQLGKPESCALKLESYHESNHVVIEISDDGRGISPILVRQKALEKNLFSQDELDRMGHRDIMGIIMKPGFSTADTVSKTSGRGVGMDVVKKNIEKLNGTIEIDSKTGVGTRFRIKIPLTLAIIQALLVRVGNDIFTIPLSTVEETLRVFEDDISMIEGVEVIHLRDSTLSLLRLSEIFGIKSKAQDSRKAFVVVVNTGMREVGLVVDSLIGQEEAVIKPMVDYLQESSGFSGATILGDGHISLILDVYELVNMSIGRQAKRKTDIASLELAEFPNPGMYEHRTLH